MDAASQVQAWIQQLQSQVEAQRIAAIEHLARSPAIQAAAVALVEASGDASETVRQLATGALEDLGPPAPSDLPRLIGLLDHAADDVAYWAATLVGRLAGEAVPAAERLVEAARRDGAAGERALWAIAQIGQQAAAIATRLEALAQAPAGGPRRQRLLGAALAAVRGDAT